MDKETRKLLKEMRKNESTIDTLKTINRRLNFDICKIEGFCPHCKNWHYPHCSMDI